MTTARLRVIGKNRTAKATRQHRFAMPVPLLAMKQKPA